VTAVRRSTTPDHGDIAEIRRAENTVMDMTDAYGEIDA
jgi:hypothetical protein